ncbi:MULTISPECIES: flagellar biosynthetic protein FliO [unclassified Nocardioides]|uniref:flagellar biosynthetic protein FliO n=1 Tax=unclassified Nocardioides TaxID=2615069 RepID=UPI003014442D
MELAVRMVVSLAVVVGLLLLCVRFGGKKFKGRSGSPLQVLHRQSLSRSSGVALVSVGGRMLLLGTTDQQVQMLTEIDPAEVEAPAEPVAEAPVAEAPVVVPAVSPAATPVPVALAAPDSLLGSMAGQVDEPTRWLQPKGAQKRGQKRGLAAAATATPVYVAPAVTAPLPALAPVEEAQVASFAATLEAELEAELKAAVAAPQLSPAQVLLQEEQDQSPLAGSLLSPDTWRLAARAVSRRAS